MTKTSDPAEELHKLCLLLQKHKADGTTRDALAEVFGVEAESSEYFETMGHLASRFSRLSRLYEVTLDDPHRSLGLNTVRHLQTLLSADRQRQRWQDVKGQIFDEVRLSTLLMSSPLLRLRAPLTVPTAEERREAIEQIDTALKGLEGYNGAISTAFASSLRSIRRTLERFEIYGVDAFTDEFLKAFAVQVAAERESDVPHPERQARTSAWTALAMVAGLMIGSDSLLTAIENHYVRSEKIIGLLAYETKLLPSPDSFHRSDEVKAALPARSKRTRTRRDKSKPS